MMDIALHDNDLAIDHGDITITGTDNDAIAQAITITLKTFVGEYFLDTQAGRPYLTEIFGHKRSARHIRRVIVPAIESVSGVADVTDFNVVINNDRRANITFTAVMPNGATHKFNETIGA